MITDPSSAVEVALNVEGDELCTWWTHVFTCALYWKHSDNASAHKHYTVVRKCPRQLLNRFLDLFLFLTVNVPLKCYYNQRSVVWCTAHVYLYFK